MICNGILLCSHCHHEVHAGRLLVVGSPGNWRVVTQLRPSDPYARATRSAAAPRGQGASVTAAATAAAPLALKLPDLPTTAPASVPDSWTGPESTTRTVVRRPRGARPPVEARLRRRLAGAGRRRSRGPTIDLLRPTRHLVMRT